MARLGRGRREGARISRNRSTPTPTQLVRTRVTQTPNGARRAWAVAKAWRRRHAHIVLRSLLPLFVQKSRQPLVSRADVRASRRVRFFQRRPVRYSRAPSVPTATPLVRKRLVQTPNGNDRAHILARVWRRKRAHIVLRAPQPGAAIPKPQQPIVSRSDVRATSRTRWFQPRGARIIRNVSTPTATPLVKPAVVLGRNRGKAARVRAFFVRHQAQFVRSPILASVPFVRHPQVITSVTSRAVRVRARMRRRARLLRAPVVVAPTLIRVAQPVVSHSSRAVQVRARARHRARLLRAPVAAPRRQQPIVTHAKAAVRILYTRPRGTTTLRSHVYPTQTRTVPKLVLGRNRRKQALARTYYARHRAAIATSTLGSAAAPVTIVLGYFDEPTPISGYDSPTATATFYDEPTPAGGFDEPSLPAGYDQPTPSGSGAFDG